MAEVKNIECLKGAGEMLSSFPHPRVQMYCIYILQYIKMYQFHKLFIFVHVSFF